MGDDQPEQSFDDYLAELNRFLEADVGEIKHSPDRTSAAADREFDYIEERQRTKIEKTRQENLMRNKFFKWISKLATGMIAGNFLVFVLFVIVQWTRPGAISDAVMVSWISATVVEVLGIITIIARHLFPGRKSPPSRSDKSGLDRPVP